MNPEELRCGRARIVLADGAQGVIVRGLELLATYERPPLPAAVLVPIVLGARPGVVLTKRNERLRRHAGQVSFPGGRIDPGDATRPPPHCVRPRRKSPWHPLGSRSWAGSTIT